MYTLKEFTKTFFAVLIVEMIFMSFGSITASASNVQPRTVEPRTVETRVNEPTNNIEPITNDTVITDKDISGENQLPNVSFDQVKDKVETKTFDVVGLMQVFVKPFASIIFLACACISLFGAISRSAVLVKGLIGMFIAGAVYTCALNAPEILNFISNWLVK